MKYDDIFFDVNELSYLLDITPRRVQQLVARGILKREGRGNYLLISSLHAYLDHLRSLIHPYYSAHMSAPIKEPIIHLPLLDRPEDEQKSSPETVGRVKEQLRRALRPATSDQGSLLDEDTEKKLEAGRG